MDRTKSKIAFEEARKVIPGGVNSPARAFGAVGGIPIFIERAHGPFLYDIDGNRYIDYIGSWGPMILGHAHPKVLEVAIEAARGGSSYGAPTCRETELAELICQIVPAVEMVRMVSSGTEAVMSAIRVARGYTQRAVIVKFAGCYHGHVDSLLVAAGSSALTHGVPSSPGVPEGATRDTVVLPYNDLESLQNLFQQMGDRIAAVILEPVVGNMGLVIPSKLFLDSLRRLTKEAGALLIYDEVMTGFRLALGGVQELFQQSPDLSVFGKIIGGGYPVGAYGGRREIMQKVMPAGPVFQAGTLSGNPVAVAAGLATLRELQRTSPFAYLDKLGEQLEVGIKLILHELKLPYQFNRVGSMWTLFFTDKAVIDLESAKSSDTDKFSQFFWRMMDQGVYLPCSQFEAAFLSVAHTPEIIEQTLKAVRTALVDK